MEESLPDLSDKPFDRQETDAPKALFMPLTGQENSLRLEKKYEWYFESDDENNTSDAEPVLGKVSQWKVENPPEWLNSQSPRGKTAVVTGGKEKQRSPRGKKRLETSVQSASRDPCKSGQSSSSVTTTAVRTESSIDELNSRSASHFKAGETRVLKMTCWSSDESESETSYTHVTQGFKERRETSANVNSQTEKEHHDIVPEEDFSFFKGFSVEDTERPKLPIAPQDAKVNFQLSSDDAQQQISVPATINQYLRDYQREGIRFMYKHYMSQTGAILGDDMGLGKTVQVIGFLAALLGKKGNHIDTLHSIPKFIRQMSEDLPDSPPRHAKKPFLIIGPSAVMYNWLDELNTWGYFSAKKFHGAEKETCLQELKKGKLEIVITTFETFRDNVAKLNETEWEAVIVDEVHKIKGLKAQVTQALRIIRTPCRFGLTGTALQNNMTELWSLLDWAQPRVLGTLEQFQNEYVDVIEVGQRQDATKRELALARKQKEKFSEIRKKMLLRRTKALISDQLPLKEDLVVMCRLTDLQVSVYKAILSHPDMDLVLRAEDPCDCRKGKPRASCCYKYTEDGTKAWSLVFSYMHLMLKAANHTALLIPDQNMTEKQASMVRRVCDVAFKDHRQFLEQARNAAFRTLSDPKYCGKMKILQGLLSVFYANHDKVLLFSYSTKLLDIIEQYIICKGHEYRRIDGKVSSQHRRDIVNQFNKNRNIFLCLVSTKAGGLGLNLTGANRVVIFDPNWNPSHDLQAQDRAYRIGQTRDVKVYRLVSAGTIEENIYLRQVYKQQLNEVAIGTGNARRYFRGIQGVKGNQGELFGVKNMFSLRTGPSCLTMDILKRNEKLERGLAGYDITHYVPPSQQSATDREEDTDDSETEERRLTVDLDAEEEEEEEFLKELFGSERSPIRVDEEISRDSQSTADPSALGEMISANSDSSDGEFSLIPRLHHKCQGPATKSEATALQGSRDEATAVQKNRMLRTSNINLGAGPSGTGDMGYTASDISFRTTTCCTPDAILYHQSAGAKNRGAISGISWLFSDNENDDNDNDSDKDEMDRRAIAGDKTNTCASTSASASHKYLQGNEVQTATTSTTVKPENTSDQKAKSQVDKRPRGKKGKNRVDAKPESKKPKFKTEGSVLESDGVLHVHINRDVVGSSRAEDHMTRCALQDVFERRTNTQAPADMCEPYSQPEEEEPIKKKGSRRKAIEDHNTKRSLTAGSFKILVGQTPAAIRRQQWSDLCKVRDLDQVALAKKVLTSGVAQRLELLSEFYIHQHPELTDVLTQLFTGPVSQPERCKKQQEQRQTSICSSSKSPSSSEAKSTHRAIRSPKRSRQQPSVSSKRQQKKKQSQASALFDIHTLASQSQESITARSPENPDIPSDEEYGNFLPKSARKKSWANVKFSPSKSQHTTRLRQQAGGDAKLTYYDSLSMGNTSYQTYQPLTSSYVDIYQGNKTDQDQMMTATEDVKKPQAREDIPALLHEMGCRTAGDDDLKNKETQQPSIGKNSLSAKNCRVQSQQIKKTSTGGDSTISLVSKISCEKPLFSDTGKQKPSSSRRKYADILDDIFNSSPDQSDEEPSPVKRTKVLDNTVSSAKTESIQSKQHISPVTIVDSPISNPHPERHVTAEDRGINRVSTADKQGQNINISQHESSNIFDDFLSTSTLRDERIDCFSRSGRKKRGDTNMTSARDKSEGQRKRDEVQVGDGQEDDDYDALDLYKFDLGKKTDPQTGSESLFS